MLRLGGVALLWLADGASAQRGDACDPITMQAQVAMMEHLCCGHGQTMAAGDCALPDACSRSLSRARTHAHAYTYIATERERERERERETRSTHTLPSPPFLPPSSLTHALPLCVSRCAASARKASWSFLRGGASTKP